MGRQEATCPVPVSPAATTLLTPSRPGPGPRGPGNLAEAVLPFLETLPAQWSPARSYWKRENQAEGQNHMKLAGALNCFSQEQLQLHRITHCIL